MSQRIKGQEVSALLVVNNEVQSTVTDIRSFEVEFQTEVLSEGYLGETTDRRDDVFRGVRGKIEFHFENQDVLTVIQSIIDRARRRTPGTVVNIKAALAFPNGQRPKIQINDVFFGGQPISFAGRTEYGTLSLDFEASDARIITT